MVGVQKLWGLRISRGLGADGYQRDSKGPILVLKVGFSGGAGTGSGEDYRVVMMLGA